MEKGGETGTDAFAKVKRLADRMLVNERQQQSKGVRAAGNRRIETK